MATGIKITQSYGDITIGSYKIVSGTDDEYKVIKLTNGRYVSEWLLAQLKANQYLDYEYYWSSLDESA